MLSFGGSEMKKNTIEVLYNLMKDKKYSAPSQVRIVRETFDGSKDVFCFIVPKEKSGERYSLEYYNKKMFAVYMLCKENCSVKEIVQKLSNMKNAPDEQALFLFVLRMIRDYLQKGILV